MTTVRSALLAASAALVVLLAALPGPGPVGWAVGLGCGVALAAGAARAAAAARVQLLGLADLVTLTRATLACAAAALVAESWTAPPRVGLLTVLATVALLLDAVDGRVARRTGTASPLGARLDGEADAFLMLVLSVHVARSAGAWVLAMGAARYAFAMAGWWWPWMRATLPPRYWRKVVTATAGVALVLAASGRGAPVATYAALVLAFLLLAESFGRDVRWLWCRRSEDRPVVLPAGRPTGTAAATAEDRAVGQVAPWAG